MDDPEITQPEEEIEGSDAAESVETTEEQVLQDATHEPGARIEEAGTFEQAEAVESELKDAVESAPADDLPAPSTDPKDMPPGSGTLDEEESYLEDPKEATGEPQVWDDRAEEGGATFGANPGVPEGDSGWLGTGGDDILVEPTPADVIEVPDGVEPKLSEEDDGTVGRDDHPLMEDLDDLEYEPGPVEQPPDWDHGPPRPKVELKEPGPAGAAEIPQGSEFKPAGEDDGTVGRDDHPIEEEPELNLTSDEPEGDEYYVDARGVIRSEDEDDESGDKHGISDEPAEPLPLEPPDPDPA